MQSDDLVWVFTRGYGEKTMETRERGEDGAGKFPERSSITLTEEVQDKNQRKNVWKKIIYLGDQSSTGRGFENWTHGGHFKE
jgi:hypothetical protein